MLGCMMPMSSPMMKRMLGLLAGVCANAGKVNAGTLSAANAVAENSMLPSFRLIFIIRSSVVIDRLSRVRFDSVVEPNGYHLGSAADRSGTMRRQVAAKLRGEFAVRYWTVVQHQRDARTANAS